MTPSYLLAWSLVGTAWTVFVAVWLVMAFRVKATVKRQSLAARLIHLTLLVLTFSLLFNGWFEGIFNQRFAERTPGLLAAGVALTYLGVALAIWARLILGGNWSGTVTVKLDHGLVQSGPYARVRHPIYSGLLLATLGSALVLAEVRGLVALVLCFAIWAHKLRIEERFMTGEFGSAYDQYRTRTNALIPFIY